MDETEESSRNTNSFMNVFSMSGGDGERSYAYNSRLQRNVIKKASPVLVETIRKMLDGLMKCPPTVMQVADLGCSSGINTFLVISEIVNTIESICRETSKEVPELHIFLNDLPENDFNTAFKLIPFFHKNLKQRRDLRCFVSGVPGSFYSRLFPTKSLHFVHSSYSLHWLSKVPEGLEDNKENVYITSSCPPSVYKSYLHQFQKDLWLFLRLRSKEMVSGGYMVLTLLGRNASNPLHRDCCHFWTLLSDSLLDLVSQGLVKAAEVNSFNLPFYDPTEEEIKEVIEEEGSFEINTLKTFAYDMAESSCEIYSTKLPTSGRAEANYIRAITEPMLLAHFGDAIDIDMLFKRYSEHVVGHSNCRNKTTINIVVSLSKKFSK